LKLLIACTTLPSKNVEIATTWKFDNKGFQFSQLENGVTVIQLEVTKPNAPKPPTINYYTQASQLKEIRAFDTCSTLVLAKMCLGVWTKLSKPSLSESNPVRNPAIPASNLTIIFFIYSKVA
jgi:hypothetical protein